MSLLIKRCPPHFWVSRSYWTESFQIIIMYCRSVFLVCISAMQLFINLNVRFPVHFSFHFRLSSADIGVIMGNLEEISTFQQTLVQSLEDCAKWVSFHNQLLSPWFYSYWHLTIINISNLINVLSVYWYFERLFYTNPKKRIQYQIIIYDRDCFTSVG